MHPLLVSAVANTASNFLDRWARGGAQTAGQTSSADSFQKVLDGKVGAAGQTPVKSPAERAAERVAKLRTELFDSPEVRAALDTADPTKPATISLTPDGRVLFAPPGRDPKAMLLAPETAEVARELASLTASRGAITLPSQTGSPIATTTSSAAFNLTPQTAVTTLR